MNPTKEALACHEAGHLLISIICEKIDFSLQGIEIKPLKPKFIMLNPESKQGEISSCFPAYQGGTSEWPDFEIVQEMTCNRYTAANSVKDINELVGELFYDRRLYVRNRKLTAAKIFSAMAGNVAERLNGHTKDKFGNKSSSYDFGVVNSNIKYLIPQSLDISTLSNGKVSKREELLEVLMRLMIHDLENFMENKNIKDVINFIAETLLNQIPDKQGSVAIMGKQMIELREEVLKKLDYNKFEAYLEKYSSSSLIDVLIKEGNI